MTARLLGTGALILMFALHESALADSIYDVTLDTSSLSGLDSTLAFDFIGGGGMQSNSVSIADFSTDGTLVSGGMNSGSVTGSLPGTAILTTAGFLNELQQGMTLGSKISFQLDATTNAPTGSSLPDTFSFFILDPTASYSLLTTTDPTTANSLFTLQIDGSAGGLTGIYSSQPAVPVTLETPTSVPEPEELGLWLTALLGVGLAMRLRRQLV
jgi:hypothetical protein